MIYFYDFIFMYSVMSSNLSFCNSDEEVNVTHYTKPPNVSVTGTQNSKVGPNYSFVLKFLKLSITLV